MHLTVIHLQKKEIDVVPHKIHVVDYKLTSINRKFEDVMWLLAESQHWLWDKYKKQHTQSTMNQLQSAN